MHYVPPSARQFLPDDHHPEHGPRHDAPHDHGSAPLYFMTAMLGVLIVVSVAIGWFGESLLGSSAEVWSNRLILAAAFLGGRVKGDAQYGRIGEHTLVAIPLLPDGALDPAYDPRTGELIDGRTKSDKSSIPNHGSVYATALHLCDLNPKGRGRNDRPPLEFIRKT